MASKPYADAVDFDSEDRAGLSIGLSRFGGSKLLWNDKCDRAFVEGVVVRVLQLKEHFVRTGGKDPSG